MGESERVRCRKCRKILLSKDEFCLLDAHGEEYHDTVSDDSMKTEYVCPSVQEHNCLYLSEESYPDFILNAVDESCWTKGKVHCPGCEARIGSFNFVSGSQCACGNAVLPQVHILRSKVDWMKIGEALPRPVSFPHQCASMNPPSLPVITSSPEGDLKTTSKPEGDLKTTSSPEGDLKTASKPEGDLKTTSSPEEDIKTTSEGDGSALSDTCGARRRNRKIDLSSKIKDDKLKLRETRDKDLDGIKMSDDLGSEDNGRMSEFDMRVNNKMKTCSFEVLDDEVPSSREEESSEDEDSMPIPEFLTCSVCLDLLYSPLVARPCLHTFCEPCLRRVARPNPTQTRCPLCRRFIGHCMPAPDVGNEARERFPSIYLQRRQFELQHNSQHLPLPWLRNFRFGEVYETSQSFVERAGGWKMVLVMMTLNIFGMALLLYLGRPVKVETDPYLYPESTFSLHHA